VKRVPIFSEVYSGVIRNMPNIGDVEIRCDKRSLIIPNETLGVPSFKGICFCLIIVCFKLQHLCS